MNLYLKGFASESFASEFGQPASLSERCCYTAKILKTCLILSLLALPLLAQEPVRYELQFPNAAHHEAEIRATFSGIRQPVLEVVMSRSSTGRYALHEFAKNVIRFRATDGRGKALSVTHTTPYQWNISGHKGTVTIEYTLFGDRADGTYDGIDQTHAHLNTPATLAWAHGFEKTPSSVKITVPEGSNWKVATQLKSNPDGTWSAPNLDFLMDSPIEVSAHALPEWKVGDAQFRIALHHSGTEAEAAAYARMAEAVVIEEEGVFGAFPKYDNGSYTFLADYLPYVSGDGMEHRDSTVISGVATLAADSMQIIGTLSHEFFHSWNVKRIRPAALQPFDFERANMSGELWFAEGFTNYYGPLTLKRAGISSIDRFTRGMGFAISTVLTAPGRQVFNVIDMSRQAPFVDAAAAIDPVNRGNNFISYYTYGQALALGIDLTIRTQFPGKTLDDWMRTMYRQHPDIQKPYTLEDLQAALADATGSKPFAEEIFRRHIYGMEPMNYEELLGHAGMLLRKSNAGKAWLGGAGLSFSDKGAEISSGTLRDTPLYVAGLDRGDFITEADGKSLKSQGDMEGWLKSKKPGDSGKLKAETRAGKKEVTIVLGESPALELVPYEQVDRPLTAEMTAFRQAWLSSKAIHPLPKLEKYCHVCQRKFAFELEHCPYDGGDLHITPGKVAASGGDQPGRRRPR
jgi:predicted metalloprotease with PDZ domain